MATKKDNTAIEFAKDAVKYYNILLKDDPNDEYLLENKQEAQLLVNEAEAKLKGSVGGEAQTTVASEHEQTAVTKDEHKQQTDGDDVRRVQDNKDEEGSAPAQ
jgi:hypothetical protein